MTDKLLNMKETVVPPRHFVLQKEAPDVTALVAKQTAHLFQQFLVVRVLLQQRINKLLVPRCSRGMQKQSCTWLSLF